MSVNLDKVITASTYNSFKNDGAVYTGSIIFPTTLTANQQYLGTTPILVSVPPTFTQFFAKYTEFVDLLNSTGGPQWYPLEVGANASIGYTITAPAPQAGVTNAAIYPTINGTTISVVLEVDNPYNLTITIAPQTIQFALCEYSLAE